MIPLHSFLELGEGVDSDYEITEGAPGGRIVSDFVVGLEPDGF